MRHFYRSHLTPEHVLTIADSFFPKVEEKCIETAPRARVFTGPLGTLRLTAKSEGGHYTFVEIDTDQTGESRLDRSAKKFYVELLRTEDPAYKLAVSF
ncbi:MAG: hypothetical protein LC749_13300 [Actinobacteria bacterium]|nr:hypothetical protein [Actinomycetota bacterium]